MPLSRFNAAAVSELSWRAAGGYLERRNGVEEELTKTAVTTFSSELGKRVRSSISDDMMAVAYRRLHRKAIVVMAWYAASYVMVLMASNWFVGSLACVSLALAMAAVGFNIQHDANHNAFFPTGGKRRLSMPNRIAGLSDTCW